MRRNGFGDVYCHTANESRQIIDDADVFAGEVSLPELGTNNPWDAKATVEIASNDDGDLVCYVEADTEDAVRAILRDLNIDPA